ncbi:hypothetical protein M8C21_030304 [Ambrosia artemisiifolia]|uniref:Cystatin domain-containing protein n=1 Tax=Ambrosia artemisiifolia TaxID=4212 RepID=A0AAD5DFN7_AMBAR|nr:hypothetical protein M8C21_030304 [Ambrosia artemisiifolia]
MQKKLFITLLLIAIFHKSSAVLRGGGSLVSTWKPIPDVNNPSVVSLGRFAVDENNKLARKSLKFKKVVKGDQQVVAGMNYKLKITVVDGVADKNYEAVVWDKPWEKLRKLVSFKGPVV